MIRLLPDHGAKFWLRVMNELRNRGVEDVLIAPPMSPDIGYGVDGAAACWRGWSTA
jgi:hypothetical protein